MKFTVPSGVTIKSHLKTAKVLHLQGLAFGYRRRGEQAADRRQAERGLLRSA